MSPDPVSRKHMRPALCAIALFMAASTSKAGPIDDAVAWWPDTEVVTPKAEQHWSKMAAEQKAKSGAVAPSVARRLEHATVIRSLPDDEQRVLLALIARGSFPWIKLRKRDDGTMTITSIDLSGRSQRIDGPELQVRFAAKVGNDVIEELGKLPNLDAVFAFDTLIDDAGLVSLTRNTKLHALWVPPLTTDAGFNALAAAKNLEWLCLIGSEAKCDSMAAWRDHQSLRTLYLPNVADAKHVAEQAKVLPKLKTLIYGNANLLNPAKP